MTTDQMREQPYAQPPKAAGTRPQAEVPSEQRVHRGATRAKRGARPKVKGAISSWTALRSFSIIETMVAMVLVSISIGIGFGVVSMCQDYSQPSLAASAVAIADEVMTETRAEAHPESRTMVYKNLEVVRRVRTSALDARVQIIEIEVKDPVNKKTLFLRRTGKGLFVSTNPEK